MKGLWLPVFCVLFMIGTLWMFCKMGDPNAAHNVAYRNFEQACKDKGGTIAHVRTSALPNSSYSCVNKDYFIEIK